jgi:hypothetical protein
MTTPTCTRCESPARWRDADGRHYCGSHVPANGKPLARLPAPPEPPELDILKRLQACAIAGCSPPERALALEAAKEIARLRALLEAAGDKSGSC